MHPPKPGPPPAPHPHPARHHHDDHPRPPTPTHPAALTACSNGSLDWSDLGRFLRTLLPEINGPPLHYVLSYLASLDLDGEGKMSFGPLLQAMQAVPVRAPGGQDFMRSFRSVGDWPGGGWGGGPVPVAAACRA